LEVGALADTRPIGVFDSGIGGLTVLKAVMDRLPDERLIYFGDTARLPYGTKSRGTVTRFAREIVSFLMGKSPKMIVVACNTASAYSLPELQSQLDIPVVGVIEPGAKAALKASRNRKIGVIGTRATIQSNAYLEAIQAREPEAKVFSKACPLFVPLIEEGWIGRKETRDIADEYLKHLIECGVDTLILGCTHYPLLKPVLGEVMGAGVGLVDSAEATAADVLALLEQNNMLSPSLAGARCEVYVSDMHLNLKLQAERFLGLGIPRIRVVDSEFEEVKLQGI
jgi:glutamate racemase